MHLWTSEYSYLQQIFSSMPKRIIMGCCMKDFHFMFLNVDVVPANTLKIESHHICFMQLEHC